jgi:tetratricopeptide (TPR) repeat protein
MNIIILVIIATMLTTTYSLAQTITITTDQMQKTLEREAKEKLSINLDEPQYHIDRGIAYRMQGNHASAIEQFSQAISLDPKNAKAYMNRAMSLGSTSINQTDKAMSDIEMMISLDPTNGEYYFIRALLYSKLGKQSQAKADIDEALGLGFDVPEHKKGYFTQGGAYVEHHVDDGQMERDKREFYDKLEAARLAGDDIFIQTTLSDGTILEGHSLEKKSLWSKAFENKGIIITIIVVLVVIIFLVKLI